MICLFAFLAQAPSFQNAFYHVKTLKRLIKKKRGGAPNNQRGQKPHTKRLLDDDRCFAVFRFFFKQERKLLFLSTIMRRVKRVS